MTSSAPSPHRSPGSSTRVRVKWDNVMIVLIGVVVAAFAVVGILLYSDSSSKPAAKDPATAPTQEQPAERSIEDTATGTLSLDDAIAVVEEVRTLMTEGRWDEASDRLELIPVDLRDASGATVAQQELDDRRASHDQLRDQLEAAVEARNWTGAQTLLKQLSALAPLNEELTATQELVDTALTPKQPATATDDATTKTSGGGGSTTTPSTSPATKPASTTKPAPATKPASSPKPASGAKPASSTPKPASGGSRPTTTGGGAGSSGGSSTGTGGAAATGGAPDVSSIAAGIDSGSSLADLGINLTPQQEAELEAALNQAMSGL